MRHPRFPVRLRALAGALLLLTTAGLAAAAPAAATAPATPPVAAATVPADAAAGLDLLRQAGEAWRAGNFRGRFVYVRGNRGGAMRMDSMQVVHAVFDGVEHERLSHLDHSTAEVIRRGNETICISPDARVTRFDAAATGGPFRAFAAMAGNIARYYEVRRASPSRVAGRSAEFIEVGPRDMHRYGFRLWVDRQSRLPLRYELINRRGAALESVEFVDIETGIEVPRDLFTVPGGDRASVQLTVLRSTEAPMPAVAPSWLPPGFSATGSQLQRNGDQESTAVTYSDGLAAFSFFVEKADADAKPMGRQIGPTVAVSGVLDAASAGRFRVTLVGEVPAGTAVKVVESARHHLRAQPPETVDTDIPSPVQNPED